MAVAARSTPNFNVPPTQNTAPVLEFRCLYTHDIHKKQKKWHDGSLRFHTFNRRVMVYDDTKNFIGDLHYRGDEEFGEGTELQLDRPVKVEVGEPIGQTQTDLRPILDRGRGDRSTTNVSQSPAVAQSIRRISALTNGGRPKSISEVLGGSQGRLSRAKLPIQSPYDQRRALTQAGDGPPATKRPRLYDGKENQVSIAKDTSAGLSGHTLLPFEPQHDDNSRPQVMRAPPGQTQKARSKATDKTPVIGKPSENSETLGTRNQQTPPVTSRRAGNIAFHSSTASIHKSPTTNNGRREGKEPGHPTTQSKTQTQTQLASKSHPVSGPREPNLGAVSRSKKSTITALLRPGMTTLRMQPHQKRRKLLYKALMPDAGSNTVQSPRHAVREHSSVTNSERLATPGNEDHPSEIVQQPPAIGPDDVFDINDVDHIFENVHENERASQTDCRADPDPQDPSSGPMFLSQGSIQIQPPQDPSPCDDDMNFMLDLINGTQPNLASSCEAQNKVWKSPPRPVMELQAEDPAAILLEGAEEREGSHIQIPISAVSETLLTKNGRDNAPVEIDDGNQPAAPMPGESHPVTGKATPSKSDSREEMQQQMHVPPETVSAHENPAAIHASSPETSENRQSTQDMSKNTASEAHIEPITITTPATTSAANPTQTNNAPLSPESTKDHDQGPWSKIEAYLLFENWPKDKAADKPSFTRAPRPHDEDFVDNDDEYYDAIDEDIDMSMGTSTRHARPKAKTHAFPGIRSARSVLRDEI